MYRSSQLGTTPDPISTIKQRGNELLVAGYCLYSAATHLVITLRSGVHIFTLDDVAGEFYLTKSNVQIPSTGTNSIINVFKLINVMIHTL